MVAPHAGRALRARNTVASTPTEKEPRPIADPDAHRPVKSADRTLDVLEALGAATERRTLGELARDLGVPKSSLHAILRTMQQRGWIETDDSGHRFGLGVRALLVGASYVEVDDQVARLDGTLDWLSERIGETVHLGRLDGGDVVYLAKRESQHPLRLFSAIGRRLPAHATALGKAILAARLDELDSLLAGPLRALTPHTITTRSALVAELEETRRRGHAVDNEENSEGIRCFAVAIPARRAVQDAISFSIPVARLNPERSQEVVACLQEAVDRADLAGWTRSPRR